MAQTIDQIKKVMTDKFIYHSTIITVYGLDPAKTFEEQFSPVSVESIIFYITAYAMYSQQVIFDAFKLAINTIVDKERWGRLGWYEKMALLYQSGRQLVDEQDYYDNTGLTSDEIATEQIVKFCAAKELEDGQVIIKLAKGEVGALVKLSDLEVLGVQAYINRIRPAGVSPTCVSLDADLLKTQLLIQYDALILDGTGKRLDGTNDTPVISAINSYLSSIKFNGEYSNMALVDAVQQVDGVTIVDLTAAWSKYSQFNYVLINSRYQPQAGFMNLDTVTSLINYTPYV